MSCLTAPTTTEEDVMTESGVCVYVFCLLSSCSCTHTHCARRGINCPCSAIVTLLANLQGAHKSQPFQGPQYTSKEKPFSPPQILPYPFPCPVLSCPLLPFPCPAVLCSCHLSAQALGWPRAIARDGAPGSVAEALWVPLLCIWNRLLVG